jgi:hypothetical protein
MLRLLHGPPVGPPGRGRESHGIAGVQDVTPQSTGKHGWDRREPPRGEERHGDMLYRTGAGTLFEFI